jgi:hypothetical protein
MARYVFENDPEMNRVGRRVAARGAIGGHRSYFTLQFQALTQPPAHPPNIERRAGVMQKSRTPNAARPFAPAAALES